MFGQNWTNEILTGRRGNSYLSLSIGLVIDNSFDVVKWLP